MVTFENDFMTSSSDFDVTTYVYKTIGEHQILTDVLVPKHIPAGSHPVWIRIHGGFLITGSRDFFPWCPTWLLEYAIKHSIIIVNPDYRLLPEAKGLDPLSDMDDLWNWIHTQLNTQLNEMFSTVHPNVTADLSRIVVSGESAGGYLAIQLALSHAEGIRAVVPAYPVIGVKAPFYTELYPKQMWDAPMFPASVIEEHLKNTKPGSVISNALPPARGELAFTIVQQGRYAEFLGSDSILYPEERISAGATLPSIFIYHGTGDTMVPFEGTQKFIELVKEKNAVKGELHFEITDGEHGFDTESSLAEVESWISSGLELVQKALQ